MNTNIFKTTIAALALLVAFNSCKKEDEDYGRLVTNDELEQLVLMEDGHVVTNLVGLEWQFCDEKKSKSMYGYWEADYYIGTNPNSLERLHYVWDSITEEYVAILEPYTKYYWKMRLKDAKREPDGSYHWNSTRDEYAETEPRSFYYIPVPQQIECHNVKGDWAAVLKWKHDVRFEDAQLTLTPDKDCNYDKNPIKISAGQDSCYISAGTIGNQKYQIYHSWWDEANGKYYEPVVYDFKLTFNFNIDGEIISIPVSTKGIFLNTDGHVADDCFNVYRYEKIGNRTWMLDDIRMKIEDTTLYTTVKLESGLELVLYADYKEDISEDIANKMIPKGFHLATPEDWLDLESHFGVNDDTNWREVLWSNTGIKVFIANDYNNYNDTDYKIETWDFYSIFDWYCGKESGIRQYLISDNEWKDINDADKKLKGFNIFNAHPAGIPYVSDFAKKTVDNPYKGYGVAFGTSTNQKRILWSGSDGICRIRSTSRLDREVKEPKICYTLWRCVKDE